MLRRILTTSALGLALSVGLCAEVVVRVGPPAPIVERERPPRPGPRYVWIGGFHRWDGHAYVWTPGRWEIPPRPHARWVAARWVHRHGGWVFVEGRWR